MLHAVSRQLLINKYTNNGTITVHCATTLCRQHDTQKAVGGSEFLTSDYSHIMQPPGE